MSDCHAAGFVSGGDWYLAVSCALRVLVEGVKFVPACGWGRRVSQSASLVLQMLGAEYAQCRLGMRVRVGVAKSIPFVPPVGRAHWQ